MKATELLKKQHREVKTLFRQVKKADARGRRAGMDEIAAKLEAHMRIEQEIFYPAVVKVDPDLISEGYEEHSLAELAVKRLLQTDPEDAAFKARVVAAKELIGHHVEEEEEEMFVKVRKAFDDDTLETLGKQMKKRFDEVLAAGYANAVPKGFAKTSADGTRKNIRVAAATKKKAA